MADEAHPVEPPAAPPPPEIVAAPTPAGPARPGLRTTLWRIFRIGPWAATKLFFLCVLVGFFVMASQFDPSAPDANILGAVANVAKEALAAAGWVLTHFWQPALAGAVVVLPFWVLWRLISYPFRK